MHTILNNNELIRKERLTSVNFLTVNWNFQCRTSNRLANNCVLKSSENFDNKHNV